MPSLSNAERQRLYRQRVKDRFESEPNELTRLNAENARLRASIPQLRRKSDLPALTPEQEVERAALIADLTSSRPWWRKARIKPPSFMGWSRENWLQAPDELLAHFGLVESVALAQRKMQLDLHR